MCLAARAGLDSPTVVFGGQGVGQVQSVCPPWTGISHSEGLCHVINLWLKREHSGRKEGELRPPSART